MDFAEFQQASTVRKMAQSTRTQHGMRDVPIDLSVAGASSMPEFSITIHPLKTNNSREACQRKWLERAGQWPDGELSQRLADLWAHNAKLRDNAAGIDRRIDDLTGGRHRLARPPLPPSPETP